MATDKAMSAENSNLLEVLAKSWQAEMRGFHSYQTLAQRDSDPIRQKTLNRLAEAEAHHAALWAKRIHELGGKQPTYSGKPTGDVDSLSNRLSGNQMTLRRLEMDESHDIERYGNQLKDFDDGPSLVILQRVIEDEKEHYREIVNIIRQQYPKPAVAAVPSTARIQLDQILANRNQARGSAAGWVGDAIYGVNDGLGSIFGIVSGVSGATLGNSKYVLLAGLAGMIASALSMGSGAYLAAKSQREIYEAEVARDREAIQMNGPENTELLSLYYQVKGLPEEDADHVAEHLSKDPDQFLRALTAERLNATEDSLSKPLTSAVSGALSTALGAFIPIFPFFFMSGYPAVIISAIVSLIAHFAVGAAKSLITVRSWWSSGMEMTMVGAVEGAVTFVIGMGLGRFGR